jgi:DNA-binding transcriptional ArsR family regulator
MELRNGEMCVNSLQEVLGIRQSAVSQHLALLKSQQLIRERREGRHVLYRLSMPAMAPWLVDGIQFIVPDDEDSALLRSAAKRAANQWSDDTDQVTGRSVKLVR